MKLIFMLLIQMRNITIKGLAFIFEKIIDPETGKIKLLKPYHLKMYLKSIFLILLLILGYVHWESSSNKSESLNVQPQTNTVER